MRKDFIVYAFHVPGSIEPFYVGKGRPERPWEHFKPCNLKKKTHFYFKLSQLLAQGIAPDIKIIVQGLTEGQAFALEKTLIKIWGRQDMKTGCLTNHTDGGEGCFNGIGNTSERSLDTLLKMSESASKSQHRPGQIEKNRMAMAHLAKPVECIDHSGTVRQFPSLAAAERAGYNRNAIRRVLCGECSHAYTLQWRYSTLKTEVPYLSTCN